MNVPILNIESIGCKDFRYNTNRIFVQYIPSLTYTVKGLFRTSEHTVYLPITFDKEEQIKELFEHYNNLMFRIAFIKYSNKTYSKEYNLIEIKNLKTLTWQNESEYRDFNIEYIVKYKDCNIALCTNTMYFRSFLISPKHSYNIYELMKNKNDMISMIQNNYTSLPMFMDYEVWSTKEKSWKSFKSIKDAMQHIDEMINEEDEVNNRLNSYYTKKSFRLVEN